MKLVPTLFFYAVALSGCAMQSTYEQIKDREPAIVLTSGKAPDVYLGCLAPRFAEIWPTAVTLKDGDSTVITVTVGQVIATATMKPQGSGTLVEYRQWNDMNVANFKRARSAVSACK